MRIIDSHCHPLMGDYADGNDSMINRNLNAEVFMITVGADMKSSKEGVVLAKKYRNKIWATVGCHPDEIGDDFNISEYEDVISDEIVAIGEVGLDYFRTPDLAKREYQKKIFQQFSMLADKKKLPLILHVRNEKNGQSAQAGVSAHNDMIELINSDMRGVAHSFTGTLDEAKKYLNLGFHLGLNGIITFSKQYDEVIKYVPLDLLLLETDSPWLAPVPYRGKPNEPRYVIEVAKRIADVKGVAVEEIVDASNASCGKLFNIGFQG